ncbi:cyclopropane-fatty-acyl-phospholipid synthase family protein [uncultured Henriciella sp.]|jgi:cyclopropane-fatty-acyl-phospholipid synthase|uniref:cyclopropane-fatty-acyl-phospholipid synthase family protein n=1 Tax=uncultured Henriciella sp. TaxID=1608424 RepID=UPI0032B2C2DB|tara:strand:+ start:1827 stop:3059 length:1233 start_codon:yes stop_codon:yes gene_type:complete
MSEQTKDLRATMTSLRQLSGVPASFRLAGLFLLRTENGSIRFNLPDGRSVLFDHGNPGPRAVVDVHEFGFAKRALAGGDIGFAESYMDGEWSTPDLTAVLEFFSENFEAAGKLAVGGSLVKGINKVRHFFNRNSKAGARRNIMAHYDLGNDFYESWLDETMTYSSALFDKPNMSLEQAQTAKYAGIADQLSAGPDSSLLEIGCGWGGFAEYAAKVRGSKVTCLTISEAQRNYAASRMQAEGLSDRVEIRLEDYRDHQGKYDGVASIEMFEAVGEAYWPSYFQKIHESLDGSAKAALQIITIDDDLFRRYRKRTDFIQRYIFPGGMLPSEKALRESLSAAGLRFDAVHYFGQDYAKTLKLWAERFEEAWDRIQTFGFDERFRRLWRFYLSYCEAGFGNGRINVGQFQLSRA